MQCSTILAFDRLTQVPMGSFYPKVIMRGYQAEGMHLDSVSFHRLDDTFQELFPVLLAPIDIHARVSAIQHVIEGSRGFYS